MLCFCVTKKNGDCKYGRNRALIKSLHHNMAPELTAAMVGYSSCKVIIGLVIKRYAFVGMQ